VTRGATGQGQPAPGRIYRAEWSGPLRCLAGHTSTISLVLTGSTSDTFAAYAREKSSKRPQLVIRTR
jgi:hypothetical protein